MVTSLIIAERIETTEAKAKEVNRLAKNDYPGKEGDLHARRQALAYMMDENAVTKLFEKIGPRLKPEPVVIHGLSKRLSSRRRGSSVILELV